MGDPYPLLRDFAIRRLDTRPALREGAGLVWFCADSVRARIACSSTYELAWPCASLCLLIGLLLSALLCAVRVPIAWFRDGLPMVLPGSSSQSLNGVAAALEFWAVWVAVARLLPRSLEFWAVLQKNGPDFDMSLEFWVVFGADFGGCSE